MDKAWLRIMERPRCGIALRRSRRMEMRNSTWVGCIAMVKVLPKIIGRPCGCLDWRQGRGMCDSAK